MRLFAEGWSCDKDGPGQRLVFYLKGCNMRCLWCANPESISPETQILFTPDRASGTMEHLCDKGALSGNSIDRLKCESCHDMPCASRWRDRRFEISGYELSPRDILSKALQGRHLFGASGGVTFGGGEPTLQHKELLDAISLLKAESIHTAMETNASTDSFMNVASSLDMTICDLKALDESLHLKMTGTPSAKVLENLRLAATLIPCLLVRVPIVSGMNDIPSEMSRMSDFLASIHAARMDSLRKPLEVEPLRMHHMGKPKYSALGVDYPMAGVKPPPEKTIDEFKRLLSNSGIMTVST